ncbi:O-antigen translocase [Neobacillus drentensis]|uniref:O-antigen translocase n=1 Tax=Neobacillus drentensis TaxID=220684 RepID=UPI0030008220
MNFLKTSILSAISSIIKILSGIVVNKIIAIYIGPSGIALIGQFQSVLLIITTAGSGAINSGVTKYVAEYNQDSKRKNDILNAGFIIMASSSIVFSIISFFSSSYMSVAVFGSDKYGVIFKVVAVSMIFISLNNFLLAVLNGLKEIRAWILANIIGSILSLVITSILTIKYDMFGALFSTVLIQSLVLVVTLYFINKIKVFANFKLGYRISLKTYRKLFNYAIMAIVTALTIPIVQILIRNHLINNFSIEQAGYWQAVTKISDMYLLVITTALSTYYLPRLSELTSKSDLNKEIISGYRIIIPFVMLSALCIFFLRDFIIWLLFTPEFYAIKPLFTFQLIGDFFKMCSWTLSFLMIAKAMTKTFIVTEIIFSISLYVFSIILSNFFGLVGVTYAFALNYFIYLVTMIYLFSDILFKKRGKEN